MKAAIFSLPLNYNIGGLLQQFALSYTLEKLGVTPYLISRRKTRSNFLEPIVAAKWALISSIPCPSLLTFISPLFAVEPFKRKYLRNRFHDVYSTSSLRHLLNHHNIDVVIVGSDQVWNPNASPCLLDHFLYNLHSPNRRILSYAASFGSLSFPISDDEINLAKQSLSNFKLVSLREASGVDFVKATFECEAHKALDPTVLITPSEYNSMFNLNTLNPHLPDDFIFVYILDMTLSIQRSLLKIASFLGLPLIFFSSAQRQGHERGIPYSSIESYHMPAKTPENWLYGIANATFVITDSFHGTLISCLFNSSFLCYGNSSRGNDRFDSLLSELNLSDRYQSLPEALEASQLSLISDWSFVNDFFASQRSVSLSLLSSALGFSA